MADRLVRATRSDLEVRRSGDGRTVCGIACPFDDPAEIPFGPAGPYTEVMRRGAFARTIRERGDKVKLLVSHNVGVLPVGRATLLREDSAGLYGEFAISKVPAGDELLEQVLDGSVDALSVGFEAVPGGTRWNADYTLAERTEVKLYEVSAVAFGAFEAARITAVRSANATPDLVAAMQRSHQLRKESPWMSALM